jgi:hypothetical protein
MVSIERARKILTEAGKMAILINTAIHRGGCEQDGSP